MHPRMKGWALIAVTAAFFGAASVAVAQDVSVLKDLTAVMIERFGDVAGYVGRPRTAAAE